MIVGDCIVALSTDSFRMFNEDHSISEATYGLTLQERRLFCKVQ